MEFLQRSLHYPVIIKIDGHILKTIGEIKRKMTLI